MPHSARTVDTDWSEAVRNRRETAVQRVGVGLATGMIVSPILGAGISLAWAAAYVAVQMIEIWVFRPVTDKAPRPMGVGRSLLGCLVLGLNTTLYCLPAAPLWMAGGAMGGLAATVMLCAAILYSTSNAPSSARVLACTVTPEFLFLGSTPLFMASLDAPKALVATTTAAIVVFAIYCLVSWQRLALSRGRELRNRAEADRRLRSAERDAARRAAYLAAVAHDLRTPIGAILTGAAELDQSRMDGGARNQAALITDAGLMMKALLDDLLDHSRLEAGAMAVEAADFNLRALLAQTMRLWSGPIRSKGLSFRIEGAHQMPAMVRGDAMRLRQVLNNLISNAVKFTETGAITLRLRAWTEEPRGHSVLIEVADTGPGMKPAQLARLFNPFDQTEEGVSARHGGSGLGLSISRNLVQLMGGRLVARSRPGEGAVFTVSLTFAPAVDGTVRSTALDAQSRADVARALGLVARSAAEGPHPAVPSRLATVVDDVAAPAAAPEAAVMADDEAAEDRPLRALVVDDHDINRRAVELILTPLGCEITAAADGLAALGLCQAQSFDVIFMDVRMPELDGRETTRRLRAGDGPNAAVPVIAVTADTGEDDIAACMAAGMTYFVSKPLTPAALLGALQHVMAGEADQVDAEVAA